MSAAAQRRHRFINPTRHCGAPGCTRHRLRSSRYCRTHERKARLYGHPMGGQIDRKLIASYRQEFADFISRKSDTPQVKAAVALMSDVIQCGLPYRSNPGADFRLRHLRDHGVTGREALEIVGGVWLLSRREHRSLPDDDRLTYHLALSLFRARPYPQRVSFARGQERTHDLPPGSHARRAVGEYIRRRLGVFFMRCIEAMNAEDRYALAQAQSLAAPFIPTSDPAGCRQ